MFVKRLLVFAGPIMLAAAIICGGPVKTLAGGVTNIREVANQTLSKVVKVTTYDNKWVWDGPPKKSTGGITQGSAWLGNMWIPWADNAEDFKGHFMTIEIIEVRPTRSTDICQIYIVYQSGENVRMSYYGKIEQRGFNTITSGTYVPNAPNVPGEWRSGGDRRIVVFEKSRGITGFRFEKIEQHPAPAPES